MTPQILTTESRFSYSCGRCGECCRRREVYVNPYEIARLAASMNIGTTKFIEEFLNRETAALRRGAGGECLFLTPQGCRVYADRPLPCRLYPLARKSVKEDSAQYAEIPPEPMTKGSYGKTGTVATYLAGQQTCVFEQFADDYYRVFNGLVATSSALACFARELPSHLPLPQRLIISGRFTKSELFDIDRALIEAKITDVPVEVEGRAQQHLALLKHN